MGPCCAGTPTKPEEDDFGRRAGLQDGAGEFFLAEPFRLHEPHHRAACSQILDNSCPCTTEKIKQSEIVQQRKAAFEREHPGDQYDLRMWLCPLAKRVVERAEEDYRQEVEEEEDFC